MGLSKKNETYVLHTKLRSIIESKITGHNVSDIFVFFFEKMKKILIAIDKFYDHNKENILLKKNNFDIIYNKSKRDLIFPKTSISIRVSII